MLVRMTAYRMVDSAEPVAVNASPVEENVNRMDDAEIVHFTFGKAFPPAVYPAAAGISEPIEDQIDTLDDSRFADAAVACSESFSAAPVVRLMLPAPKFLFDLQNNFHAVAPMLLLLFGCDLRARPDYFGQQAVAVHNYVHVVAHELH
jgi:hypothetical protein